MDAARLTINTPFGLYSLATGANPEHFALPLVDPPAIALSEEYVATARQYERLLSDTGPDLARLSDRACHVSLRLAAHLLVGERDPVRALSVLMRHVIDDAPATRPPSPERVDLATPPADALEAVRIYFGIAHELGHVSAARRTGDFANFPVEPIARAIDVISRESIARTEGSRVLIARLLDHESAVRTALIEEVYCDIFAARILHRADNAPLTSPGDEGVAAYVSAFLAMSLVQSCAAAVRAAARGSVRLNDVEAVFADTTLSRIRFHLLLQYLAAIRSSATRRGVAPDGAASYADLVSVVRRMEPQINAVQGGHNHALRFVLFTALRGDLMQTLIDSRYKIDARQRGTMHEFVAAVRQRGMDCPDLGRLESIAGQHGPFDPAVLMVPFLSTAEGSSPYVLHSRHGFVVFCFRPGSDLLASFVTITRKLIPAKTSLDITAVVAPSDVDAVAKTVMSLGPEVQMQCIAAVEGTRRFDDLIDELRGGTIWDPEDRPR